jgi:hypothetical protein
MDFFNQFFKLPTEPGYCLYILFLKIFPVYRILTPMIKPSTFGKAKKTYLFQGLAKSKWRYTQHWLY